MEHAPKLGCVLMAAGNARRFGENKLSAPLDGRSLILRALEAVPSEKFETVVVVTQYPEIMRLAGEFHFAAIHNDAPEEGISRTSALRNVELPMMYAGVGKKERIERAKYYLEMVGIQDRMSHRPDELSEARSRGFPSPGP